MTTITQEQALKRWDALPDNIREALCSEVNSDFIWKTCEGEHIANEKIYTIAKIAGYVLMGLIHSDDMPKEISSAINIDLRIADLITKTISARIFIPLQKDINEAYKAKNGSAYKTKTSSVDEKPTMIEEIQKPVAIPSTPAPITKTPTPQPVSFPSTSEISAPAKPISLSSETPTAPQQPSSTPVKAAEKEAPKPVILQENASFESNKKTSEFHIDISDDKLKGLSKAPQPLPQKAAILEFGPIAQIFGKKTEKISSDFPKKNVPDSPSLSSKLPTEKFDAQAIPVPGKNRTVTEITAPVQSSGISMEKQSAPTRIPIEKTTDPAKVIPSASTPPAPISAPAPIPVDFPSFSSSFPSNKINNRPTPISDIFTAPIPVNQPPKASPTPKIIQKDYSEADLVPKGSASSTPSSGIPIPPKSDK